MACETCLKLRERAYSLLTGGTVQVEMMRDYTHAIAGGLHIKYLAGATYRRVPEAVAVSIAAAGAGTIDA